MNMFILSVVVEVANVNIVVELLPVNCSLVTVTPAALSMVISWALVLVSVIPVPAVNCTAVSYTHLTLPTKA